MSELTNSAVWRQLKDEQAQCSQSKLTEIFAADPVRAARYCFKLDGLTLDISRSHITDKVMAALIKLAEERKLPDWRVRLFSGDKINTSEKRSVLHTALRAQNDDPLLVDGLDIMPEIRKVQKKIAGFVNAVREGVWRGATGLPIENVVNIGIGGSDLGPRLAVSALRTCATSPAVHLSPTSMQQK